MASQEAPRYDRRGSLGVSFRAPSQASGPTVLYVQRVGRRPLSISRATDDGCKASHAASTREACQPLMSASISNHPAPWPRG
jgi:hypothetical protein